MVRRPVLSVDQLNVQLAANRAVRSRCMWHHRGRVPHASERLGSNLSGWSGRPSLIPGTLVGSSGLICIRLSGGPGTWRRARWFRGVVVMPAPAGPEHEPV